MAGTVEHRRVIPGETVEYELFIQEQLTRTRRQVKLVELAVAAIQLCVLVLGYVLLVVLVDHWLFTGGLGVWGRLLAFLGLVVGGVGFLAWRVLPLLASRVNPVYAAHSIEQVQPTSKNSLINFLLLRRQRDELAAPIYDAIERKAAFDLVDAPVDTAVDRSHLVRAGYALLALVTILCVYKLLSPKDPLRSVGRMAAPWADLPPATRVTIGDVHPGSTKVFQGEAVTISALVMGLRRDEPVTVFYSTADGQNIDRPVEMRLPETHYRHEAFLPADAGGLQQTIEYYIKAGDATTDRYRIEAVTAPAILVDRVEYQYPAYVGLPPRVVERQGDIKAIEGTKITLYARANVPLETAYIDFNSDGGRDLPLVVEGQTAKGQFVVAPSQRPGGEYKSYQIRFLDPSGRENPQPVRHSIEVLPDQAPLIEVLEPTSDPTEMAVNGSLAIALRAADRDFKLRRVTLFFQQHGKQLKEEVLLDGLHVGTFQSATVFRPQEITGVQFKSGDEIEFWAEARDNRAPNANRAETLKYRIRLTDKLSSPEEERQRQQAEQDAERARTQPEPDAAQRQAGTPPPRDNPTPQADQLSSAPTETPDPQRDPARAMEEILRHAQETSPQPSQPSAGQAGQQPPPESDRSKPQPSQENAPEEEAGNQKSDSRDQGSQQGQASENNQSSQGESSGKSQDGEGSQSGSEGNANSRQPQSGQGGGQQQSGGQQQGGGQQQSGGQQQGGGQQQSGGQQRGQQPGASQGASQNGQQQSATSGDQSGQQSAAGQKGQAGNSAQQAGQQQGGKESGAGGDSAQQQGGQQGKQNPAGDQRSAAQQRGQQAEAASQRGDQSTGQSGQRPEGAQAEGAQRGDPQSGQSDQPTGQQRDARDGEQSDGQPQNGPQGQRPSGQQPNGQPRGQQSGQQPGQQPGEKQAGSQPQQQPAGAGSQQAQGGGAGQRKPPQPPGQQPQQSPQGAGDQAGAPSAMKEKQPPSEAPSSGDETGGDGQSQQGNSGTGQSSQKSNPSPQAQGENQARNKQGQPSPAGQDANENREEGSSPSNSNKESNAQGGESGDRSGGGKQGGGQKANQPGTGSAGQNTAADEGSGQAAGEGDGEASDSAGDKVAGQQPREGQGQGQQTAGRGRAGQSGQGSQQSSSGKQKGDGQQQSGGQPGASGDGMSGEQNGDQDAPRGGNAEAVQTAPDEANLEYKKQATELVLDRLKDQLDRNQVDPELLDKLKWTKEDLQRFVQQWEKLRAEAKQDEPGRKRFEQALERLNLQRRGVGIRQQAKQGDDKALREMRWTNPPAEYEEQFKAYTEGTTRGSR